MLYYFECICLFDSRIEVFSNDSGSNECDVREIVFIINWSNVRNCFVRTWRHLHYLFLVLCRKSMAADEKWYFTKEQLQNTPSRKCGFDADKELSYRQQAANFIQDLGQKLHVYPWFDEMIAGARCEVLYVYDSMPLSRHPILIYYIVYR